jgi:hypothetical protein
MRRHNLLTNLDQRALATYRSFHFERIRDWIETKSDSATDFSGFSLCGHSRVSEAILGALSPHPKIPFPAAGLKREVRRHCAYGLALLRCRNSRSLGRASSRS